jgi:hypothetical protein
MVTARFPPASARAKSHVNGMTVHILGAGYETPGQPAVLPLHGFPELAYSWRKVMPSLAAAGYHAIHPPDRSLPRRDWSTRIMQNEDIGENS